MGVQYKKFVCIFCNWEGFSDDLIFPAVGGFEELCPCCEHSEGLIRVIGGNGSDEINESEGVSF